MLPSVLSRSPPGKSRSISSVRCAGAVSTTPSYSSDAWKAALTVQPLGPSLTPVTGALSRSSACSSRASASGSCAIPSRKETSGGGGAGSPAFFLFFLARPLPAKALSTEPCAALEPVEPRERVTHRELLGVAGVDPGDERIGDVVDALPG